jgi:hypothetical protein
VATVDAQMSLTTTGLLGLTRSRISDSGQAQVEFTTLSLETDRDGDHSTYLPPNGHGLSTDTVVRKVLNEAQIRAETLKNLTSMDTRVTRPADDVTNSLTDAWLQRTLPAMSRGEEMELVRHGSSRVTARAEVDGLEFSGAEREGGNINVLNEVNQVQVDQHERTRELGGRVLIGPHWRGGAVHCRDHHWNRASRLASGRSTRTELISNSSSVVHAIDGAPLVTVHTSSPLLSCGVSLRCHGPGD